MGHLIRKDPGPLSFQRSVNEIQLKMMSALKHSGVPNRIRPRNHLLPVLPYRVARVLPSPRIPPPLRPGIGNHGTGAGNYLVQPDRDSKPARESHRTPNYQSEFRLRVQTTSSALRCQQILTCDRNRDQLQIRKSHEIAGIKPCRRTQHDSETENLSK